MSAMRDALIGSGAVNVATTRGVTCPYCNKPAAQVTGKEIYSHRPDLAKKVFWQCAPCGAYVGCHEPGKGYGDGTRPLGRLANAELRAAKMSVHQLFDPMWRDGAMTRRQAYKWLANRMGIRVDDCHVGEFDVKQCHEAIAHCSNWLAAAADVPQ